MRQPSKTNFAGRDSLTACPKSLGFSLLELVIVLAILAAIMAIAWPRVQPLLRRSSHRAAALRLKADLATAREQAVRGGEVWELRAVLGTNRYVIGPMQVDQEADPSEQDELLHCELPDEVVFSLELSSENSIYAGRIEDDDRPAPSTYERSDDIRIYDSSENILDDSRSLAALDDEETRLAKFFPDGRATETVINLVRPETQETIAVRLRGLTGGVTIGPTESMAGPAESLMEDLPISEESNP